MIFGSVQHVKSIKNKFTNATMRTQKCMMGTMAFWTLLQQSFIEWHRDKASKLAASTAYYTVFSIAPLLIIAIAIASLLMEEAEVEAYIFRELQTLVGQDGMGAIASMVEAAHRSADSVLASVIGFVTLFIGASGLMLSLQDSFNHIWKVEAQPHTNTILLLILKRLFSLAMILTIGFLLLVSLVLSAVVGVAVDFLSRELPTIAVLLPIVHTVLTFAVITLLFLVFYKFLPDIHIPWKTVLPGAALTAALFTVGKIILGMALGKWNFTSAYGVAGSIIVLLLWINYSAQVMFLGGEFTKVYARRTKALVVPRSYARFSPAASVAASVRRATLWNAAAGVAAFATKVEFAFSAWHMIHKARRWMKKKR